jgi:hypothetical protein
VSRSISQRAKQLPSSGLQAQLLAMLAVWHILGYGLLREFFVLLSGSLKLSFPSIPNPPPLSGLAHGLGFPASPIVKGQWFKNQEMRLDGWSFQNCRFDGCRLNVASTTFKLERCYIDEHTSIVFEGAILNVVRLFHVRNEYMKKSAPYFAPTYHEDGTISIGAA